jgi:peroxiredoxin
MVAVPSTMLPLGTVAPDFTLPDPDGRNISLGAFNDAAGLLVMFICNHCPFVKHIRRGLAGFCSEYQLKGLAVLAINSNDVEAHPEDSAEKMAEEVEQAGYTFPYLLDEDQQVAKTYQAACTPDFFLFDHEHRLVYRGQFDDSRPSNDIPVTGCDLRAAADAVLEDRPVNAEQKPSIGCNIKWKPGNAPEYFVG